MVVVALRAAIAGGFGLMALDAGGFGDRLKLTHEVARLERRVRGRLAIGGRIERVAVGAVGKLGLRDVWSVRELSERAPCVSRIAGFPIHQQRAARLRFHAVARRAPTD